MGIDAIDRIPRIDEHLHHGAPVIVLIAFYHLDQWRRYRVKQNLETLDWPPGLEVPLSWYLSDARNHPLKKAPAFRSLCRRLWAVDQLGGV